MVPRRLTACLALSLALITALAAEPPHAVWPRPLRVGDTIGVVAPAGAVRNRATLERGLDRLRGRGYRVRLGANLMADNGLTAGTEAQRAADLNAMWRDESVQAIWCAKGGYGTLALLDLLDWATVARRPLPLVGYSDITGLQMAVLARTGLVSFHGPMVADQLGLAGSLDAGTLSSLFGWLGGLTLPHAPTNPNSAPLRAVRGGQATGRLIGGNLSLLAALCGSRYLPETTGAILVIEDVNEYPYRVARMLDTLKLAGVLDRIGGLVIGSFTDCFEGSGTAVSDLLAARLVGRQIPIVAGLSFGHVASRATLPLGALARLDATGPSLTIMPEPQ